MLQTRDIKKSERTSLKGNLDSMSDAGAGRHRAPGTV
jgi:hypothetical protein